MRLTFLYRDASNYKDMITVDRDPEKYPAIKTLKPGDDIDMSEVGVTQNMIPMIVKYGLDKEDDHTILEFVEVEEIFYLVYDKKSLEIISTHAAYGKKLDNNLNSNRAWINVTHPGSLGKLADINITNKTHYGEKK